MTSSEIINTIENKKSLKWVRSPDGMIAGVCKGLAPMLELNVGTTRLLCILAFLVFGIGLGLYILLAIALPRQDKSETAMSSKIWGVCVRVSRKTDIEVGAVRFIALLLIFLSFGATLIGYLVLHLALEGPSTSTSTENPQ